MNKKSSWAGVLANSAIKAGGSILGTAGKTIKSGLAFGGKPTFGQKVTRFAVKGTALGGLGYGGYKVHQSITRPVSENNYHTYLRNNILAGNISGDEINAYDKSKINDLGMR
jgi:hypothetical protein